MAVRNVKKSLAGMEDIAQGKGLASQTRGGKVVTVHKVDVPIALDTTEEMSALDVVKYTRARVYSDTVNFVDYIYDPLDNTGIASDKGSGTWLQANKNAVADAVVGDTALSHVFDTVTEMTSSTIVFTKDKPIAVKEDESTWSVVLSSSIDADGIDIIESIITPSLSFSRVGVKPTISFIFDDGYQSAVDDVMPLFKSKGMTCGFAVSAALMDSSSTTYASISSMLSAQEDGFEILNHGLDPTPLLTNADGEPFARSQINGNYDKLRQFGFNVQSYVAGNSTLAPEFISIVKERHSSAYTVNGSSSVGVSALQSKPIDSFNLFRPSLFTSGLANAKLTVDAVKKNNGWAAFFDHDPTQVFFPSSMSLVDLEALLDYIIAQGVQVVNPSEARQQLGTNEYRLATQAINESSREQGLAVVNQNLLRDPWYKTLNETYSGWGKGGGSGDGTFTPANRKNGNFGNEVQLTVATNSTILDGTYILQSSAQRRESDFFPTSGNLTFSCEPYLTNTSFSDNFELTIGINQRKTSDNSLIISSESDTLKIDTKARKYQVTISPPNYSDATYFTVFYRITEKTTGVGGTVLIANPKLEQGNRASRYTDDAPIDINDYDFAEAVIDLGTTGVISDTKLELTSVNKNFYQIIDNEFLCRDTGFYAFDLVARGVAGSYSAINTTVKTVKNGVTESKITESPTTGARLEYNHSQTRFFKSGDTMHYLLSQAASGGAINIDTGVRSYLRICKIG